MQTKELVEALAEVNRWKELVADAIGNGTIGSIDVAVDDWRALDDIAVALTTSSGGRGEAWRPIESAPTRVGGVLLWFPLAGGGHEDGRPGDLTIGHDYRMMVAWWDGSRFREQGTGHDILDEARDDRARPTEWTPIPAPPTSNHAASAAANQNPENVQGEA